MNETHPPSYYIRKEMEKANLKPIEVANIMGMRKQNFNNILNGTYNITLNLALKLEKAFPKRKAAYWINKQNEYNLHSLKR